MTEDIIVVVEPHERAEMEAIAELYNTGLAPGSKRVVVMDTDEHLLTIGQRIAQLNVSVPPSYVTPKRTAPWGKKQRFKKGY